MHTQLITAAGGQAQVPLSAGPPRRLVCITATFPGEMTNPENFIQHATRVLDASRNIPHKQSESVTEALALILTACEKIRTTGQWPASARNKLQALCSAAHATPVSIGPIPEDVALLRKCADALVQAHCESTAGTAA